MDKECPKCGTPLEHYAPVGDYCPNRDCSVADAINGACEVIYMARAGEVERLRARVAELEKALSSIADAADEVGVQYFDTDCVSHQVIELQDATLAARAALASKENAR